MIHIRLEEHGGLDAPEGIDLLQALTQAGFFLDAPCGGQGKCGKCRVLVDGEPQLACRYTLTGDITVRLPQAQDYRILAADSAPLPCDGTNRYVLAFDIGTTTVVAALMDGHTGVQLSQASCLNPQVQFGADVISRIQYALEQDTDALTDCIRSALCALTVETAQKAGIDSTEVTLVCAVGNTAMHHLLLGLDVRPLVTPPYMPARREATEQHGCPWLPVSPEATLRVLPNIAGFVGADTVGCLVATHFDTLRELTLLIDIGTNGEMVLGDGTHRIACSTAAGPAFEGAKISCGMRGAAGAIDHAWVENGALHLHVLQNVSAVGICGSGLLDLIAALLELGVLDPSGRLSGGEYRLPGTELTLTQQDVREVQLAKAAVRAGIELLRRQLHIKTGEIRHVCLAGAFGNYLNPASACRIGMIPPELLPKITGIGNAAGDGAKRCALSRAEFERGKTLAAQTEFLELASRPDFQDRFVDALSFGEEEE